MSDIENELERILLNRTLGNDLAKEYGLTGDERPAQLYLGTPKELLDELTIYTNKAVADVLDRLERSKPDYSDMDSYNRSFLKAMYEGTIDKAIEAERQKLTNKEVI